MKKISSLLVMIGLLMSVIGVFGDEQNVNVDIEGNVDFTLETTEIDYGNLIPEQTSEIKNTDFTIGETNNVPIEVSIKVKEGSEDFFENIYYELNDSVPDDFESQLSITTPVTKVYEDPAGASTETLQSVLKVPLETTPNSFIGVVEITAMDATP